VTSAKIRARKRRRLHELAAFWCAVLACDRATNAWAFNLPESAFATSPVLRLAWAARTAGTIENERERQKWTPGVTRDNAPQTWARAEAMLRTGWRPA
jgi:hypothetical protein